MDEDFFGTDLFGELFAEPGSGVDGIELDVAEGIAGDVFAGGFHLFYDGVDTGAFGDEEVDVVVFVHDGLQALGFGGHIDFHFGDVDGVNVFAGGGEADFGEEVELGELFAVDFSGVGGEPAAVAAHDFVDDEHAGVGVVLGDDVLEVACAFFGGGPSAEGLLNGKDVVVDGFGEADNDEVVVVFGEVGGEVGGGGVGVVSSDGVQDVDVVFDELVGGDF